ncbi:MAG: OmpA family protein [Rhizobiaceae bacterium]
MNNWLRWILPGLVISAVLTYGAVHFQSRLVQEDITARAKKTLIGRHPWAEVVPEGRDLTLGGIAPTRRAVEEAFELAGSVHGVRIVADATMRLDVVAPYNFNAEKNGDNILIAGHAPDPQTRSAILAAAGLINPAMEITDKIKISAGAPEGFRELATFALLQLKELSNGKISLVDSGLEVSGKAESSPVFSKLMKRYAGEIPAGINIVRIDITPPEAVPYVWNATFDGKRFVISGYASNKDIATAITTRLKEDFNDVEVVDKMHLASGAPEGFQDAVSFLLDFFASFKSGRASISDNKIALYGIADSEEKLTDLRERMDNGLDGFVFVEKTVQPRGISPYTWSLTKAGGKMIIGGHAPGFEFSQLIRKLVGEKFSGHTIEGGMAIAAGWSKTYGASVSHAIDLLSHLENGSVKVVDSQIKVSGTADSADDYKILFSGELVGPENVSVSIDVQPAEANPYRWSVSKDTSGVRISGNVFSRKEQEEVSRLIKSAFENELIDDQQTLASGNPDDAMKARRLLIDYVGKLAAGEGILIDDRLAIVGRVDSREIAESMEREFLANLPAGFAGSTNILFPKADQTAVNSDDDAASASNGDPMSVESPGLPVADPYRWSISKVPAGITVIGNAPNQFAAKTVIDLVKEIFSVSDVADKQVLASGKPVYYFEVQKILMRQVNLLDAGQGNVIGNQVSISGRAKNENIHDLIERAITEQLPEGYLGSTNLVYPKSKVLTPDPIKFENDQAENCQAKILETIDDRKIDFETNLATIKKDSEDILKDVINVVLDCPTVRIEIGGHTDSHGRDSFNQELSKERADAVISYMVNAGIEAARLVPKGYGETSPVAANNTSSGRAKNRRIEFKVIP